MAYIAPVMSIKNIAFLVVAYAKVGDTKNYRYDKLGDLSYPGVPDAFKWLGVEPTEEKVRMFLTGRLAMAIGTDNRMLYMPPADPVTGYTLREAQKIVGGYVEAVRVSDDAVMLVDEEGLLKNYPVNPQASILAGRRIVGDVLICHPDLFL